MSWAKTGYGQKFFEILLPNGIKQLTRIADALEEMNRREKLKEEADYPNFYRELTPEEYARRMSMQVKEQPIVKKLYEIRFDDEHQYDSVEIIAISKEDALSQFKPDFPKATNIRVITLQNPYTGDRYEEA